MEGLASTAAVLGVVGFVLNSSKDILKIVSAVKDGPQNVARLSHELEQLQIILQRFTALPSETRSRADLINIVNSCAADIAALELKIRQLTPLPAEKRSGRLWKKLRVLVSEKELDQVRQMIHGHVLMLHIHLGLAQTAQLSASSSQLTTILGLLNQLKDEVASLQGPVHAIPSDDSCNEPAEMRSGYQNLAGKGAFSPVLEDSVARLLGLMDKSDHTVQSDDAAQLIDDLQKLLDSALNGCNASPDSSRPTLLADEAANEEAVSRELRLMGSLVFSAPSLEINRPAPKSFHPLPPPGTIIHQARKRKSIHIDSGVITVQTNTKRRKSLKADNEDQGRHNASERDFIASIIIRPKGRQSMITLSVQQSQLALGALNGIPRISTNNIKPSSSLIFKLAAQGKLEDILSLIADSGASLRDHDEDGWSLLHYASQNLQLPLCKFLVENGLDVDEIADDPNRPNHGVNPLHLAAILSQAGKPIRGSSAQMEVSAALLQNGADPTVDIPGWGWLPHHLVVNTGDPNAIPLLNTTFRFAGYFLDPGIRDREGMSAFLTCCSVPRPPDSDESATGTAGQHVETIALFLRSGSNINERDNMGRNCLHILFSGHVRAPSVEDRQRPLTFLVSQGADVRARNNRGQSVSEIAYKKSCQEAPIGSYRGDLWDAVLDACGYDISEFRSLFPRRGKYTSIYTRQEFERLWEGREDRCPYYYLDDCHWPETYPTTAEDPCDEVLHHCSQPWCSPARPAAYREQSEASFNDDLEQEIEPEMEVDEVDIDFSLRRIVGHALEEELEDNPWLDPQIDSREMMEVYNDDDDE